MKQEHHKGLYLIGFIIFALEYYINKTKYAGALTLFAAALYYIYDYKEKKENANGSKSN